MPVPLMPMPILIATEQAHRCSVAEIVASFTLAVLSMLTLQSTFEASEVPKKVSGWLKTGILFLCTSGVVAWILLSGKS